MTRFNEAVTKFSLKSFASVRNIWVGDTSEEQFLTSVPKPLAVTRCFRCYSQPISESCYYWLQPTYSGETKPKRKEKKKRKGKAESAGMSTGVKRAQRRPTVKKDPPLRDRRSQFRPARSVWGKIGMQTVFWTHWKLSGSYSCLLCSGGRRLRTTYTPRVYAHRVVCACVAKRNRNVRLPA